MGFWGRHDFWEQTSRLETLVVPVETWTWNKNERSQVYIYIIFNASEQGHILTYFLIRAWSERLIYRSAHNGCICSILYLLKLAIKHFQRTFKPLNSSISSLLWLGLPWSATVKGLLSLSFLQLHGGSDPSILTKHERSKLQCPKEWTEEIGYDGSLRGKVHVWGGGADVRTHGK